MLEALEVVALIKNGLVNPWTLEGWESLEDRFCEDISLVNEAIAEWENMKVQEPQND